jgi:hypothetical protein
MTGGPKRPHCDAGRLLLRLAVEDCLSAFAGMSPAVPSRPSRPFVPALAIGTVTGQAQAASVCFGHKPTIVA